jgi:glycosyltransferase involved in cell wall biosynthesis
MPRDRGGAILIEPESHASLAEGMKRLAADADLRARLGASARAYAERKFAKQPALERLEAVLLG